MTGPPLQPDYEPPPKRRSIGVWLTLLIVWGLGLVSWLIYAAALIYLLNKF